jgi:hypothetical protein
MGAHIRKHISEAIVQRVDWSVISILAQIIVVQIFWAFLMLKVFLSYPIVLTPSVAWEIVL